MPNRVTRRKLERSPSDPFLYCCAKASGLRLKGKALEFFFSLLIRSRQRAENLFVWIIVLPTRHAQAGFGN